MISPSSEPGPRLASSDCAPRAVLLTPRNVSKLFLAVRVGVSLPHRQINDLFKGSLYEQENERHGLTNRAGKSPGSNGADRPKRDIKHVLRIRNSPCVVEVTSQASSEFIHRGSSLSRPLRLTSKGTKRMRLFQHERVRQPLLRCRAYHGLIYQPSDRFIYFVVCHPIASTAASPALSCTSDCKARELLTSSSHGLGISSGLHSHTLQSRIMHCPSSSQKGHSCSRLTLKYLKNVLRFQTAKKRGRGARQASMRRTLQLLTD